MPSGESPKKSLLFSIVRLLRPPATGAGVDGKAPCAPGKKAAVLRPPRDWPLDAPPVAVRH